jgi:dephospho-CoA kinase
MIFLIAGNINSGKDYTANILVKNHRFVRYAFADTLKEITAKRYNVDISHLHTHIGKEKLHDNGKTYRQLLIDTAGMLRTLNENFFVDSVIEKIAESSCDVVISDFRYPNEHKRLREKLKDNSVFHTVLVKRDTSVHLDIPSERSLDTFEFDTIIYNQGSNVEKWFRLYFS